MLINIQSVYLINFSAHCLLKMSVPAYVLSLKIHPNQIQLNSPGLAQGRIWKNYL